MMKRFLREYGYLAVMAVCLVCCAAMVFSVATDRPLLAVCQPHVPVLRTGTAGEGEHLVPASPAEDSQETGGSGCLLTEQYLEGQLAGFLPKCFPARQVDISMEDGLLGVGLVIDRSALKDYLKEQGVELGLKRTVLLQLLPRQVELEAAFVVSADDQGLHLSPVSLAAGEKEVSLSGLPQNAFCAIDQAVNALLDQAGVTFYQAEFTPEGLLLK